MQENSRRIYYYDDDSGLDYIADPGREELDSGWEGYNEGAYRGGWNDDLQYMAERDRERERQQQRGGRQRRGDQSGPYSGMGPRNFVRADARIMDDIMYRMTMHGHLDASRIGVTVQNGVVQLNGAVRTRQEKRIAEDVADSVSGVKDVENQLRVTNA